MKGSSALRIVTTGEKCDEKRHSVAHGAAGELVWMAAMALICANWFPSARGLGWALFGVMVAMAVVLRRAGKFGKMSRISLIFLGILLIFTVVFRRQVLDGLAILGNDLLAGLTAWNGRIYLDFTVTASGRAFGGLFPLAAMGVFLLEICHQRRKIWPSLPLVLPIYVPVLLGIYPVDTGVVLVGLAWCLMLMDRAAPVSRNLRGLVMRVALVSLCITLAAGTGLLLGDGDGYARQLGRGLHSLMYHGGETPLPEGQLEGLGAWTPTDTPALKITMSEPGKVYLRGSIYETYTGTAWLPLENQERAEAESLFYWLHETGFYGQSQIGTASAFLGDDTREMTIENVGACTGHGYAPYAMASGMGLDSGAIGDDGIPVLEQIDYFAGSVPQWYEAQHLLAGIQQEAGVADYLAAENAYREYVHDVDLQLTNESWSVLHRQLGEADTPKTLSQIRTWIREYLEEHLVYDESVVTASSGQDFLRYTLEGTGSGYSVHYATAAVLMLRYFGVPARYVEGYYLSAEEAAAYQAGDTITLTQAHAHAWAEYYLPGVGFVPFEVTPGYLDDEEAQMGGGTMQDEQTYIGDHLKYAQVEEPEPLDEPLQNRVGFAFDPAILWYLLPLVLVALAVWILLRRKKLARALERIEQASNREAIALRYGYALALQNHCAGILPPGAERAAALNQEALFSCHEMTDHQREEMDGYAAEVLTLCRKKWSLPEKMRYRLWECLY